MSPEDIVTPFFPPSNPLSLRRCEGRKKRRIEKDEAIKRDSVYDRVSDGPTDGLTERTKPSITPFCPYGQELSEGEGREDEHMERV